VSFTPGKPFLPYEQLLAVQPPASCTLLPEAYHYLMTSPTVGVFGGVRV
jgi:5'-3' exoribonuclease 1